VRLPLPLLPPLLPLLLAATAGPNISRFYATQRRSQADRQPCSFGFGALWLRRWCRGWWVGV